MYVAHPIEGINEEFLIKCCKKNAIYFQYLYIKYYQKVLRYILLRSNKKDIAEDLTQETFVQAYCALPSFKYKNISYFSYLVRIAKNLLINNWRKASRYTLYEDMNLFSLTDDNNLNNPQSIVDKKNLAENLNNIMNLLSLNERKAMSLKYKKDFSIKEISKNLNKSPNAIKLLLVRARRKMKSKAKVYNIYP